MGPPLPPRGSEEGWPSPSPGESGPLGAFFHAFLPGIRRGLVTAFLVVFIPALGSYVIPDLVGGPSGEMIGNKIAQRTFADRNLPHAAGLSAFLTLAVLLPMAGVLWIQARKNRPRPMPGEAP